MLSQVSDWRVSELYPLEFHELLCCVYNSIEILQLWKWMRENPPPPAQGYMFWHHSNINKIISNVDVQNCNYNRKMMIYALRVMQDISNGNSNQYLNFQK